MLKLSGLFLMLVSFAGIVSLLECDRQNPKARAVDQGKQTAPTATPLTKERPGAMNGEIKELAAGSHCTVFESFVFVAHDPQTYQELQNLNITLPNQDAEFFKSQVVIAAFLGQRRTGGFGVEIKQDAAGVMQVFERTPKGMVTMVLTTPFKIVAVPIEPDVQLVLALDATWKDRLRTYRLSGGELTVTGGFAGVNERSVLEGTLQIMRATTLVTLMFDLKSTGKRQAQMRDVASGTVTESGGMNLAYLDSHSLSGAIQSPFQAIGQFTNDEKELSLNLETVPAPQISDNFGGRAFLKATAITPRPPNRAVTGDD